MNDFNSITKKDINYAVAEIELSYDLNVITNEILGWKKFAGMSIFEIGKRLKHVKETLLENNEWKEWCKNTICITSSSANKYIRVYEEFRNEKDYQELSLETLHYLTLLDVSEREKIHYIPETGTRKKFTEMSREEQRSVLKIINAEKRNKEEIEKGIINKGDQRNSVILNSLKEKLDERFLQEELEKYKKQVKTIEKEKKLLEIKLESEKLDAEHHRSLKQSIDNLRNEKDDFIKRLNDASTLGKMVASIEHFLVKELAPVKYCRAIDDIDHNDAVYKALNKSITKVENWCEEIRSIIEN